MSTQLVDRRTLLKSGLAAGAAVALVGAASLPGPAAGMRVLSAHEAEIVAAMAEAFFPKGAMPVSGAEAGVVRRIDEMLEDWFPPVISGAFRYLLRAVEWGTLASRGCRFTELDPAQRREVLDAWDDPGLAPRRIASDAMKMAFGIAYFSHGEVLDHIGWRSACGGRLV
ncbi:MAG: gluconate 2-dehydrogenase subunit 3 family protein [Alphaproteobacteria bacterium]|nr:gluconate 2-dehydrogenase subunit 3 family protein [Alphaproteobacteria bacterium]